MPDNAVLETIQKEIKSFGDDTKKLKDSMQTDLAAVRKLAEEAKGAAEQPEIKAQIDALTASVAEKQDAFTKFETRMNEEKARIDELETAFGRQGTDMTADEVKASRRDALGFYQAKMAASGNSDWRNRPTAEKIDLDGYRAWEKGFDTYLRAKDDREVDSKALSVGSNPDGGYLVPTARSARITQKVFESSPIRQLATIESIGTDAIEIPYDIGEAGDGWVGEEQTRTETTTPTVGMQKIPVHEMYSKPKVTQKFLEDAAINVEAWLANKVGERMARTEATAFVSGSGVGQPRGILKVPSGSAGARNTILQLASGSATAVTADAIVKMPYQIKGVYLANATWLMKRSTVQAVMLLKDGQGQYLWRAGITTGQPSSLAGYSVMQADDMPAEGAGNLPIAFGDFRRGYTVVDRLGITTLRDPFSAKPFVEFYTRRRVGGDVVDFEAFALMVCSA